MEASSAEAPLESRPGREAPTGPVLIVEDDADIRETVEDLLTLEGHRVVCATNGQEALELLEQIPRPCLILLDMMMPVMDGRTFMRRIQADQARVDIPVVVMSASTPAPGATAVLKKPFDLDVLVQTVQRLCDQPGAAA